MEMLVTLVLVALAAALMSQMFLQLARVEALLASGQLPAQTATLHARWIRELIESSLPTPREAPDRFQGDERRLGGTSTEVPAFPDNLAQPYELLFEPDGEADTRLVLRVAGGEPMLLLRWTGRAGRFRYLDARGDWHAAWPPALGAQAALPTAVVIETGQDGIGTLLAAPRVSPDRPLPRRQAEQL